MNRHDPALLDQIIGTAEKWLRRCNGQPAEGFIVDAAGLRVVLGSSAAVTQTDVDSPPSRSDRIAPTRNLPDQLKRACLGAETGNTTPRGRGLP